MYTSYIGRRALSLYNDHVREGEPLSPKGFFDDVLFPLFFDHERYLFWPNNAPFAQPKYSGSRDEVEARTDIVERLRAADYET